MAKPKRKPAHPTAKQQWSGVFFTTAFVAALDVAIHNGLPIRDPGGIYFLLTLCVTYWAGLRSGLISIALILGYLSITSYIPGSAFEHASWESRHVLGLAIVLPFFCGVLGLIRRRIRTAEIREYNAIEAADEEAAQRLQTEAALQSSEQMWRLVVATSTDAIVVFGEDGLISLWNQNAESMFKWTAEEAIGQPFLERFLPTYAADEVGRGLRLFLETGDDRLFHNRLELSGVTKDGDEFPIELTLVPHKSESGTLFVAFIADITEHKKLTDRLRQAQKMEAIGTLAGGIAHDFNNIIAAIGGNAAIAKGELPADHIAQQSITEIEKAVTRAAYVVRQILNFSRSKEANPALIQVGSTIEEALGLLRAAIPSNVTLETRFEDGLPPIFADATDVHQIILNLGINAAHAMRDSGGRFEVRAEQLVVDEAHASQLLNLAAGKYVRIVASDTGCGMDAQTLQRVFEPFFTTKKLGEGTGLGLSVVYGIIDRHGGAVTVYSEPGKGTTFHIYFPAAEATLDDPQPAVQKVHTGRAERILYVDDDEALVFMMTRMLRRLNYQVTGYERPDEALTDFAKDPMAFDVLITDMSMPYLDGPDLVKKVKEIRPDLPIVMVTGYIRPEDTVKAKSLGIQHLVLKPNTVHEMSDVLNEILTPPRAAP